jgi:hypothetical protein
MKALACRQYQRKSGTIPPGFVPPCASARLHKNQLTLRAKPRQEAVTGLFQLQSGVNDEGRVRLRNVFVRAILKQMAVRQFQLTPEAEPILESVAASFGGDASLALSELLIAHESIESFLDEMEGSHSTELIRQRERSAREFRDGLAVSWEKVKLDNGL